MKKYYVGMDIHKKMIWYCVKQADGEIIQEGRVPSRRAELDGWLKTLPKPCVFGMEATLFSSWIYDHLHSRKVEVLVGHPQRMKAIAGKKQNDCLDARSLADLLRSNFFPACYMAPAKLRELRLMLRYRGLIVREATRFKNKTAGLLMEAGAEYDKDRLHGKRYFNMLLEKLEDIPDSVRDLLRMNRGTEQMFEAAQATLTRGLKKHPQIRERVARLMTIPGVGEVTALTWALEVGEPARFPTTSDAVSYCGLCSALRESAGKIYREPLSKQRNKHLQHTLIEAAKLAPRWNPRLEEVYEREMAKGADHNQATLAVARKLVAYLLSIDKSGREFEVRPAA